MPARPFAIRASIPVVTAEARVLSRPSMHIPVRAAAVAATSTSTCPSCSVPARSSRSAPSAANGASGGDLVGRAHVEAERLEGKARTGFYLMGIVAPFLVLSAISGVFSAFAVMCFIPFAMGLFMVVSDGVLHRSLLWWKRGVMQFANGFANGFMFALVSVWFASCSQRAMLSPYAMQ